jgi:putative OPT family oligopeptide transporter
MSQHMQQPSFFVLFRIVVLSIFLTILLAASSTYLALKVGILPSASIPAAILAMALLRLFNSKSIHETNLIQTAASAGEAVAGGIVFTLPALVIIGYWHHFPYWINVVIALSSGVLGILFSIPLRKILLAAPQLRFPEARAITTVLQASHQHAFPIREMLMGAGLGAFFEFLQTGVKLIASAAEKWIWLGHSTTLIGFGVGFSPALIGVGYLVGLDLGLSLFLGALIAWGLLPPLLTSWVTNSSVYDLATQVSVLKNNIHYIGLGAMLTAGLFTLIQLLKPFYQSILLSVRGLVKTNPRIKTSATRHVKTERDIPVVYLLITLFIAWLTLYLLLGRLFPSESLPKSTSFSFLSGIILGLTAISFIFAAICGYFSGLVGVTASPGSAIIITGMLLTALLLRLVLAADLFQESTTFFLDIGGMTLILGGIIAGASCIANDNIQDLKVGALIGTPPWQQQLMLTFGVIIASFVIPFVMEVLFNVYGLTTVMPHPQMNPAQTLPAPPAAMMAALVQSFFNHNLPWLLMGVGAGLILVWQGIRYFFFKKSSLLGFAMGIYLPLSTSIPLFLGSLFAYFITKQAKSRALSRKVEMSSAPVIIEKTQQRALLLACGLVAGATLMDVLLAIPISITGQSALWTMVPHAWQPVTLILGILSTLFLAWVGYRVTFPSK